jgi:hypothetical protein
VQVYPERLPVDAQQGFKNTVTVQKGAVVARNGA